jgi:dUTPase
MNILYQIQNTFWQTQNNLWEPTYMVTRVRRSLPIAHGLTLIDSMGMSDYEDLTREEIGQLIFGN